MEKQYVEFHMLLSVHDKQALLEAALQHFRNENPDLEPEGFVDEDGESNLTACVIQLIDPGISPAGCEIEQSSCDLS